MYMAGGVCMCMTGGINAHYVSEALSDLMFVIYFMCVCMCGYNVYNMYAYIYIYIYIYIISCQMCQKELYMYVCML